MPSPLVLKHFGSPTRYVGACLCAILVAIVLLCAEPVQGQEIRTTASHDLYPRSLDLQLRQIVESPAVEVEPLREVSAALLAEMNSIVLHIERHPTELYPHWGRFLALTQSLELLRWSWRPTVTTTQPYIPSVTALDEIILGLHRRIHIWQALLLAESADAVPITTLYGKSLSDIDRLMERTLVVRRYFVQFGARFPANVQTRQTWCDYLETRDWLIKLEASRQHGTQPIRLVSSSSPTLPVEVLETLSSRANITIQRLNSPTFTNEQRTFLNHPVVRAWKDELQRWSADVVTPIHALQLIEQYESTGGMTDMRALARFVEQLSTSRTLEYRQLGEHIRWQYGMPNTRIFLSRALLNNHLPPAISERAAFRDVIQSQPVVGLRQSETEFVVSFVPQPDRVLISLDFGIDLATFSRADAFATQLFNTGETMVAARKQIELTERGFIARPSEAAILDHRMRLIRMNTDFDGLPFLQGVFRGIVRTQYEDRFQDANTETKQRILRQVRNQIDWETRQRLRPINDRIRTFTRYVDEEFDMQIEQRESRTDENWLLTAWGVRSDGALGSNTPPPATMPGSFADLKIHESLPNMMLGKLELEGKQATVRDFKEMVAERFQRPGIATPGENDHIELMFASCNPVVVRFVDGRAELKISIAALRLGRNTYRDFQVIVRYKPAYDSDGRLVLERDDVISVINVPRVGNQFVLRAAFGVIFPVNRPFSLVPNILEEDLQFDYLTTGNSRIEYGWFAIALVEKPE